MSDADAVGPGPAPARPAALVLAALGTAAASGFMLVMAALSLAARPSALSAGIAGVLGLWGLLLGWAAVALWRRRPWSRGLVVAASFASMLPTAPWTGLAAALALVTAIAGVLPATSRALSL